MANVYHAGISGSKYLPNRFSQYSLIYWYGNLSGGGKSLDGDYHKLTSDLLHVIYDAKTNYRVQLSGQIANRNLDGSEMFYLGGMNGVRAYGASEGSGDIGFTATAEVRRLEAAAFIDTGAVKSHNAALIEHLSGWGVGLRYNLDNSWHAQLDYARKINAQRDRVEPRDHSGHNGVQIGNSAEINVGSLHIANKKIDNINRWNENTDIANALKQNKAMTNAELMSLGYINANKLVFEGERVVIDMDRLSGLDTTKADALTIVSKPYDDKSFGDNRKYDVVLGSSTPENAKKWGEYIEFADNGTGDRWQGTVQAGNPDAPNQSVTEFFTYRWIKDGKELENIGKKQDWGMGDHYALRYSIDLTGSNQTPIGNTQDNAFKGKFDGLDNSIFGLSINNSDNSKGKATGLFGFTDGAIMGNVTLIAGNDGVSIQGGDNDTGAFIGHAVNTTVKGVNSTLKVSGKNNVGGIIGYAKDDTGRTYSFADAFGSVQPDSRSSELSNLTNTGNVSGVSNVGGLVGYMNGGKLSNDEENRVQYKGSYNLGKITGIDNGSNYSYNIGGMIGKAENATVGGTKNTLINYNTVEGGYNVGGIVGSAVNTTVANASNEGVVKANGFTIDSYIYHTDYTGSNWQNNNEVLPGTHKAEVRAANVGGIVGSSAGSELKDVTNKADVSSALVKKDTSRNDHPSGFDHYAAGQQYHQCK